MTHIDHFAALKTEVKNYLKHSGPWRHSQRQSIILAQTTWDGFSLSFFLLFYYTAFGTSNI